MVIKLSFSYVTEPPSEPRNVAVSRITKDAFTLTWDSPESDGGAPISGYSIDTRAPTETEYVPTGRVTGRENSFEVQNLAPGKKYQARVWAENPAGQSATPGEMAQPAETKPGYSEYAPSFS